MKQEIDVQARDNDGATALLLATNFGNANGVESLLHAGANVEAQDKKGQMPLMCAVNNGRTDIVKLLLKAGANVEIKDKYGQTPLFWAAGNGNTEMVTLLMNAGSDIYTKDESERTPLIWAVAAGHLEVAKLLLNVGATFKSKEGTYGWRSHDDVKSKTSEQLPEDVDVYILQASYGQLISMIEKFCHGSIFLRDSFPVTAAVAHVEMDADGSNRLLDFERIVSLKVRGLYPATPDWLVKRLTKVIVMRRQQFYDRRINKRSATSLPGGFDLQAPVTLNGILQLDSFPTTMDQTSKAGVQPMPNISKTIRSQLTLATYRTVATEILEPVRLVTVTQLGKIKVPNPPKEPYGRAFECTQCFQVLPARLRSDQLWRLVSRRFLN